MTNQRSFSSSSFGVSARMVCVDSKSGKGSSSFFTSRGIGAGAVATTTCCRDLSLFGMGPGFFGMMPLRGITSDCGITGRGLFGAAGTALLAADACITGATGGFANVLTVPVADVETGALVGAAGAATAAGGGIGAAA